jgi:hypothetical protein
MIVKLSTNPMPECFSKTMIIPYKKTKINKKVQFSIYSMFKYGRKKKREKRKMVIVRSLDVRRGAMIFSHQLVLNR